MAVAVGGVDPAHGWPGLVFPETGHRIGGAFPRIGTIPGILDHLDQRVRRVGQEIVALGRASFLDLPNFLPDPDHRIHEAIELLARLALRGLDHERAGYWERHRGRMEAVIDDPLGNVLHFDSGRGLERPHVENALVGDESMIAGVEHRVVVLEPVGDVIGAEDRDLRRLGQSFLSHQCDVGPGDRQDRRTAPGGGGDGAATLGMTQRDNRMIRQERGEVLRHADRTHAGTAAAMRDAESLVQVQVADIGAEIARTAEPDLGVHVGAIHVDLPAILVNDLTDLTNA